MLEKKTFLLHTFNLVRNFQSYTNSIAVSHDFLCPKWKMSVFCNTKLNMTYQRNIFEAMLLHENTLIFILFLITTNFQYNYLLPNLVNKPIGWNFLKFSSNRYNLKFLLMI